MTKYEVIPELSVLKPIRFLKYSNTKRMIQNFLFEFSMFFTRPKRGIRMRRFWIRGYRYEKIKIIFYDFKKNTEKLPVILYFHGGAFQVEGTPVHIKMITNMMVGANHNAIYVKYRLAPKHPFPTALMDGYHALQWIKEHEDFLNIDASKITIAGDSAGGNLATTISLLSRDLKGPKIYKQMMFYPVIDMKQETESQKNYFDTPMWNSALNRVMWQIYLKNGDHGMLPYASPSLADLKDLPKTYIETAEFDPLRDEGVLYAKRLKAEGVEVTEHHTFKTVHGYDAVFFSNFIKEMTEHRINFLKEKRDEEN
ncbi:MAG: alpha/beta hydrolase [Acholeplasmataceae bacterium]|nr:alpha/beta hydrolase [Acholeplasmataceae bacterium]